MPQHKTSSLVLALFLGTASAISIERNNFDRNVNNDRNGRRDIAETHIDPWVFDKVDPNVEWAPLMPRKDAPKRSTYTPPLDARKPGMKSTPDQPVNELFQKYPFQSVAQYSPKFDGNGDYSPVFVEDFVDSKKFDNGVGGGIDQDTHPYPRRDTAYDKNGGANKFGPAVLAQASDYSDKFKGNGQYSPVYVEDFTDSKKFDDGVGGGIDQDTHPYPRRDSAYDTNGGANKFGPAVLAQGRHHRKHHKPSDFDREQNFRNLHQARSEPFGRHSKEWHEIEGQYKMYDYYDKHDFRTDTPYLYNGGKAGWGPSELSGLLQRQSRRSEFDNI